MRKLLRLLAVLAVLCAGGWVRADLSADEEQLRDLELGCATALVNADTHWLDSFYDQDWILIGSDGWRYSRKQTLAQLRSGSLKWMSIALSEMDIRVFGDAAVVVYKAASLGETNGAKIEETEICSDAFIRVDGKWRCVHSHNCLAP